MAELNERSGAFIFYFVLKALQLEECGRSILEGMYGMVGKI